MSVLVPLLGTELLNMLQVNAIQGLHETLTQQPEVWHMPESC